MKQSERNLKTKKAIIHSLIVLIDKKSFSTLNVTDLTREAHIGRGTFYIHYTDKNDLLRQVEDELLNRFKSNLDELIPTAIKPYYSGNDINKSPSKIVIHVLDDFYENHQLLAALLGEKGDPLFLNKIKRMFSEVIDEHFKHFKGTLEFTNKIPKDFVREMMMDILMDAVVYWIKKPQPESPEQMAEIISNLQGIAPYNYLQIKDDK